MSTSPQICRLVTVGKNDIRAGVRWKISWMVGARIVWIRSVSRNALRPLSLEMRMSSTGHLAEARSDVGLFDCVWMGINRMWSAGMRIRVSMFHWPRMKAEFHGMSSQTRSIVTTNNGISVDSGNVSTWRTTLSMSSGSYSGLAIHELVQRYKHDFRTA